ncbi:hypothetical protein M9458_037288, partial [Cirrhinus mrigala]
MGTVPTLTLPICTLYSWIQAPLPPEGQSAPDPGAEPPSLWRGDRKATGPRSSREDHQPRPRTDGQLILTAHSPQPRTENREQGCEKDPMPHLTHSNVVL